MTVLCSEEDKVRGAGCAIHRYSAVAECSDTVAECDGTVQRCHHCTGATLSCSCDADLRCLQVVCLARGQLLFTFNFNSTQSYEDYALDVGQPAEYEVSSLCCNSLCVRHCSVFPTVSL